MKPLPFVLGTDIIRIARLDPLNNPKHFTNVARRILHPFELAPHKQRYFAGTGAENDLRGNIYPWLVGSSPTRAIGVDTSKVSPEVQESANQAARFLAGRWAAKEAAKKAWGAHLLGWKDVRVELDYSVVSLDKASLPVKIVCSPSIQDSDQFGETEEDRGRQQDGRLSISHDGEYCVATMIAEPLEEALMEIFLNRARIINKKMEDHGKALRSNISAVKSWHDG